MVNKKVAFKTLGCRLNQYETESLATGFQGAGYEVVNFKDDADVFIINSCTVTQQSDHKSRSYLSNASRRHNKPIVILTGCMANNHETKLKDDNKITYLVKNESKSTILNLVDAHYKGEVFPKEFLRQDQFAYAPAKALFHTRSMVKIQDGCDNHCSFCIIPNVRGRAISRPKDDILENIRRNIANGYKEIVITGVNIGRYDDHGINFENLLKEILDLEGDFRVRISSLEPDGLSDDFIQLLNHPKLCPHLHLCLQSGSEKVLLQMRRFYSLEDYMDLIEKIKHVKPDMCFTTDIIVGFPNEENDDFDQTIQVAQNVGYAHIHTFKYSEREGTRAARIKEQVPEKVKSERSEALRKLSDETRLRYFRKMIGKRARVLIEKQHGRLATGLTEHYIPVQIELDAPGKNQFHQVTYNKIIKQNDELIIQCDVN